MDRNEFIRRLTQLEIDHRAASDMIIAAQNARGNNVRLGELNKLLEAADENYVQASLKLQRKFGIKTPVEMGRTE